MLVVVSPLLLFLRGLPPVSLLTPLFQTGPSWIGLHHFRAHTPLIDFAWHLADPSRHFSCSSRRWRTSRRATPEWMAMSSVRPQLGHIKSVADPIHRWIYDCG